MAVGLFPLQIGPIRIELPVIQAALSGYGDWPMRVIARRLGAPLCLSGALLDQFVLSVSRGPKARRYLRTNAEDAPAVAQLMGSDPETLAAAARKMAELGFAGVDLNFGCPVRKVVGKCRGGWLLARPEQALRIVARVRDALPERVPLTLKMRRAMDDSPESREQFLAIFDGAFALGVAAITVHARTVRQRYAGRSSWEFLRELKRYAGQRTVLGSGDLFSAQACLDMLAQTGVDGVAVARGALGNPWIFAQLRALAAGGPLPAPPSLFQQREVLAEHYRLAEQCYGAKRAGAVMRNFGIKYARLHPAAQQVRDAFVAVRQPAQWWQVLARWYALDGPGRDPAGRGDGEAGPGR